MTRAVRNNNFFTGSTIVFERHPYLASTLMVFVKFQKRAGAFPSHFSLAVRSLCHEDKGNEELLLDGDH